MKWLFFLLLPLSLFATTPKIVVFDYGGVIADANYFPLVAFLSRTMGTPAPPLKQKPFEPTFKESLSKPPSYWEAYAGKTLSKNWVKNYHKNQQYLIDPIHGMHKLIQSLKKLEIQVALLSNTSHARTTFLESKGAYAPFNPVLLSCNLGVKKPNKKIYELLLSTLDIPPQQCLFIDDKERNIDAAKALGIDGIVFHSSQQLKQELLKRGIAL